MRNQLTEFADAINGAACKIFTDYGDAVNALQTVALVAPPVRPVAVALSLGQWAAERNCTWDQDQEGPSDDTIQGCRKAENGYLIVTFMLANGNNFGDDECLEILGSRKEPDRLYLDVIDLDGEPATWGHVPDGYFVSNLSPGATCADDPDQPGPPPPPPPPYTHVTEEGCELTVNFQAWGQMPDGTAGPIFRIEPAEGTRASGGIIGGCNFNPTIVYSPGGGGGDGGQPPGPIPVPYLPDPDGEGNPLWKKLLEAALAGAVSGLVQNLFDQTDAKLDQLLACACPEKPVQEGDYRTISFRAKETSPYGSARLRKRFKYRSQSGLDLRAVVDHWRDFEFAAGPITVGHVGSSLGSPQVWAASIDEGKRVIRHAGGEAGIDPDQVGEWRVGGSDNARYGVSGEMKVDTTGGYYWITARDGSDGLPLVVRLSSDP